MPAAWNKIDSGLALIYANYQAVEQYGEQAVKPHEVVAQGGLVRVELHYQGSLAPIESAGFQTEVNDGKGRATGLLHLRDLEAIAALNEVVSIHYGSEPVLSLDTSVPQIKANRLWTLGPAPLFEFSGNTGAGVLIGIIDTGIDITHPFLWKRSVPDIATRVLRIWDMGLIPVVADGEASPDKAKLEAGTPGTYGVEYKEAHINDVLNKKAGVKPIRHRDCAAHGTHVASIAAGDGRFKFKFIGVAPRADLIIVKMMHLQNTPKVGAANVPDLQQFKDAISYILNTAKDFKQSDGVTPRPVAINCSFGSPIGAHDGLDERDDWLAGVFADGVSAGRILVVSAGNEAGNKLHATITFAAAGSIEVPLELFDTRAVLTDNKTCVPKDDTKPLVVDFYYRSGGPTLKGSLKTPGAAAFAPAAGLDLGSALPGTFSGHSFVIVNAEDAGKEGGVVRKRNVIRVVVQPKAATNHIGGTYTVKLTASAAMTVEAWALRHSPKQGMKFVVPPPAGVAVTDRLQINSMSALANIVSVAAYDNVPAGLPTTFFSSRGPVARHGVGAAPPPKPDIGAPGLKIMAAESVDNTPNLPGDTWELMGTSMAAPHVTGAVALMLQKKPGLKPSEVVTKLKANALKVPAPVADEVGGGRLDVEKTFNNT